MKIFTLRPNENWICDTIANEFDQFIGQVSTRNAYESDVVWLLADFCWNQIPYEMLKKKKVVVTCHHYVPSKFDVNVQRDFKRRDEIVDLYHVPNERTKEFIQQYTKKPIIMIPYWINLDFWKLPKNVHEDNLRSIVRNKLNLPHDKFLIASFQRDTEGSGISQGIYLPKIEKGPDTFCDLVEYDHQTSENVEVLLGGWRRQYVISRLEKMNIKYHYFELPTKETIRDMYIVSSLYVVGSRYEGGPQAILEAAALKTPIISTPVGLAEQVLHPSSINRDLTQCIVNNEMIEYAYNNIVENFDIKKVIPQYLKMFEEI
jgi:glycosyltransferase involved in cell wall biosynthesis